MFLDDEENIKMIIIKSLSNIGIEVTNSQFDDDLRFFGLDSLSIILLLSEIEKNFSFKLNLSKFNEEKFYTVLGILSFIIESRTESLKGIK